MTGMSALNVVGHCVLPNVKNHRPTSQNVQQWRRPIFIWVKVRETQLPQQYVSFCCTYNPIILLFFLDCGKITILGGLEEINQWSWYGSIVPIRALLLPPKEYKKLMTLQTHIQEHRRNPEFNFKVRSVTSFIFNTLKLHDFKEEDVATVLAIFDTNAFEVSRPDLNQMVIK